MCESDSERYGLNSDSSKKGVDLNSNPDSRFFFRLLRIKS